MSRWTQWIILTTIWVVWAFFDNAWRDAYLISLGGGSILFQQWIGEWVNKKSEELTEEE